MPKPRAMSSGRIAAITGLLGLAVASAACAPPPIPAPDGQDPRDTSSAALSRLATQPFTRVDLIETQPWLGLTPVAIPAGDPLPPDLLAPDGLTLAIEAPLFPEQWAARLSSILDMPVRLEGVLPSELERGLAARPPWQPRSAPAEGAPAFWSGPLGRLSGRMDCPVRLRLAPRGGRHPCTALAHGTPAH